MASHHPPKNLIAPLARARGLGSAKSGYKHWWAQRVSAMALAPLTLWFVYSAARLAAADQAHVHAWLSRPASAILMSLFIVATFYHLSLGVQADDDAAGQGFDRAARRLRLVRRSSRRGRGLIE
jgi:succinate dehydrogenase / fumarate reductase membrane anchor subunit